jgi:hypothetical protein
MAAAAQPESPHWPAHQPLSAPVRTITTSEPRFGMRPQAPRERLHTRIAPPWLPHTIQLCIHCGERPAGFWVSHAGGKTVRRPWCLSCREGPDQYCCDIIPFNSQHDAEADTTYSTVARPCTAIPEERT